MVNDRRRDAERRDRRDEGGDEGGDNAGAGDLPLEQRPQEE